MGLLGLQIKRKPYGTEVLRIELARISPRAGQPRRYFDAEALARLSDSIRRYGVLQPISVREREAGYEIIAGERRFRAATMAGLSHIPCIVYAPDEEREDFFSVVENLLREDLNMFETAAAMDKLCREHGLTQEEVAARLSVSQSYVANKLRLLRFDPEMREKLLTAGLTERHARALLRLPPEAWRSTVDRVIARHMNVEATERLVEELSAGEKKPKGRGRTRLHGALRDVRVFYNSVDRAVETMRRCGVSVESRREESEDATLLIIRIPKTRG